MKHKQTETFAPHGQGFYQRGQAAFHVMAQGLCCCWPMPEQFPGHPRLVPNAQITVDRQGFSQPC